MAVVGLLLGVGLVAVDYGSGPGARTRLGGAASNRPKNTQP